jgi:hypothetical protein
MKWYPFEGMSVLDDRAEPLIWPGLESLTLGKIESAGEVPCKMDPRNDRLRAISWAADALGS